MRGGPIFLELSVQEWLEELGERGPVPGGGSAAAMAGAMAASLVAMAARLSADSWAEAGGTVAQAAALRTRLAGLAQADAEVYAESLRVLASREEITEDPRDQDHRDYDLGVALDRAAQAPLTIAQTAGDVVVLAAETAERCEAKVRPDAEAALVIAAASAQAAARLVEVNLAATKDDPRVLQARAAADAAGRAMRRAFPPE